MADLTLRVALASVLSASVDRGGDRHGLLLAMNPSPHPLPAPRPLPHPSALPGRPGGTGPRVPAPRRPLDDVAGGRGVLAAVHPLHPQPAPGDGPAAA